MNAQVEQALEDIRRRFAPTTWIVEPDDDGGAKVRFGPVPLGGPYHQADTWMAGHVPAQIPYADVYPIFVRGDLTRIDGAALKAPLTAATFMGQPAIQVSRRSNGRDPAVETPALKFVKVLDWMKSQ